MIEVDMTRRADDELRFVNPGSPFVSSDGSRGPIVRVVDQNAKRSQPLLDPATPPPILYAVDGRTMKRLWSSGPKDLEPGGKYVTPVVAHGVVYVATDRPTARVRRAVGRSSSSPMSICPEKRTGSITRTSTPTFNDSSSRT